MPKIRVKRPRGRKPLPADKKKVMIRFYVLKTQAKAIEKMVEEYLKSCE